MFTLDQFIHISDFRLISKLFHSSRVPVVTWSFFLNNLPYLKSFFLLSNKSHCCHVAVLFLLFLLRKRKTVVVFATLHYKVYVILV